MDINLAESDRAFLDRLIDEFIDFVKSMLVRADDKATLYSSIKLSILEDSIMFNVLNSLRKLTLKAPGTLSMYYDLERLFKRRALTEADLKFVLDRIKLIIVDEDIFTDHSGLVNWSQLTLEERRNLFESERLKRTALTRFSIDGDLWLGTLRNLSHAIEWSYRQIYEFYLLKEYNINYDPKELFLKLDVYDVEKIEYNLESFSNLRIVKIQYASPGFIDVLGVGKVFEMLIKLIKVVIFWKQNIRIERLNLAKQELESILEYEETLKRLNLDKKTYDELKYRFDVESSSSFHWLENSNLTGASILKDKNE